MRRAGYRSGVVVLIMGWMGVGVVLLDRPSRVVGVVVVVVVVGIVGNAFGTGGGCCGWWRWRW